MLALRRAGAQIDTFTVRSPGDDHLLSEEDRQASATTHVLVPPSPVELVGSHLRALLGRPRHYLSTLRVAIALSAPGARATLWQIFYFGEAVLMWRECERRGIRHIHAHHANVASDVALLAGHLGGEGWSWSFTMHGPTELFDVREHRLPEKIERAELVVCISHYARSQLMGLVGSEHWGKLRVVHCGVDLSRFDPPPDGRAEGALEILSVGRAVPVKGQILLIDAVHRLARRGLEARLTVVGDGPELPALRDRARQLGVAERVTFAGVVGQDEIGDYYARADLFASPTFAEGIPVVLMEAMSMELPVVASRIAGIPELIEDGVSGLLVVPGDADQLTEALASLVGETPERRREMGRAGREKVRDVFDVEQTSRQLLDVFAELRR